ncbi:MAG: formylglycine-generating enzyme family protein [Tepidisphaeraceae bacterium]
MRTFAAFGATVLTLLVVVAAAPPSTALAPLAAPDGMVFIPGGTFGMGCDDPRSTDSQPLHPVTVNPFFMDATPVTNEQFEKFVEATKYVTVAERKPEPKDYPGVPLEKLVAGSAVFTPPPHDVPLDNPMAWWSYVPGASWKHPEGPQFDLKGREHHPVVQICFEDALAYAKWAGKRLPTEAEYEFAARGGLEGKKFSWGDELTPGGKYPANIWTGRFPAENTEADGFKGTSSVQAFPPNGYGLYDMGGNVWVWCSDWYRPDTYQSRDATTPTKNPGGAQDSFDPAEPGTPKRVLRGGSFLCAERYCTRYLVGSRGKGAPDSAAPNIGLRLVKDVARNKER